jgi:hypothetical protein
MARFLRKSAAACFVDAPVLIAIAAITLPVSRRANERTGNSANSAADYRISHVVTPGQRAKRSTTDAADHGTLFCVGAAGKGCDCRKRKYRFLHDVLL